jgi:DNA-directed RNA polymerase subunit beta'
MVKITNNKSNMKKETTNGNKFADIRLRLASPEQILEWSHGEVTKPETINYRTQRSEKNGLFDEKIFGPEKDYECYCGKYKGIRYKGVVCEKCGVELTRAIVRRERMAHIDLATPVAHIWFLKSMPSRIALILGMNQGELEKVVYFAGYLITKVNEDERIRFLKELESEYKTKTKSSQDQKTKDALKKLFTETKKEIDTIQKGVVLDEVKYHKFGMKYATLFEAEIGAEAVHRIFKEIDLVKLLEKLESQKDEVTGANKEKLNKRISLVKSMVTSKIRPEWMFITRLPVIPPGLRPMVALDGGRSATSDVNDLYRRVINRNNRLKKLKEIAAPEVILRNEKRILQEAVDSLIDNSMRRGNQAYAGSNPAQKRPLKSLADNLKGKKGLFRQNLLGKRVDYSGRSVIVVGPNLNLNQCGLPKKMALELFRPYVISELIKKELAFNVRGAGRMIEEGLPEVWEILEEVIRDKYVLLNRAPTLHRLGIQAFKPILIEGNAIQVHPMVCSAFNADFDGDQMAVHVPLSEASQYEAREIMAADKNILKPASGDPVISAKLLDIVLGVYWATKLVDGVKGEGKRFPGPNMAITAYDYGIVDLRAKIAIRGKEGTKYQSKDGKPIETTVGRILFNNILPDEYPLLNEEMNKKKMQKMVDQIIEKYGIQKTAPIFDAIKNFGFEYAAKSGVTWGIDDIQIPQGKYEVIEKATDEVKEIERQFNEGFLSEEERYRKIIEVWHGAKNKVEELIPDTLDKLGSVYDMYISGARGSLAQITQMAGMKGLIQNSKGETIEYPVLSSSKEGLTPIEYFTTTHGSRKGMTDTALNTARAGYLTRKLFSVAQDVVVTEKDCGTTKHVVITKDPESVIDTSIAKKVRGRVLAKDVIGEDGKVLFKKNTMIYKEEAEEIEQSGVDEVAVFSPLTCNCRNGVCAKCYGLDMGKNEPVDLGEAVGTVAAQAIGEPGTQLTMRTFHAGGTASVGGDITQGLPRVEELFERRKPSSPAVIARIDGLVTDIRTEGKDKIITLTAKGNVKTPKKSLEYVFSAYRSPLVKVGDEVEKGQFMTDGSADLSELFKYAGKEKTQEYMISQINKIYELQGEAVSRKHIEIIIRQMFSRVKVTDPGDTELSVGDVLEKDEFDKVNDDAKIEAKADPLVLGIAEVALTRNSFLSAASFQHTNKILINSSIRGSVDKLTGLKENVIIGRLIPAGTGFEGSEKHTKAKEIEDEVLKEYETEE